MTRLLFQDRIELTKQSIIYQNFDQHLYETYYKRYKSEIDEIIIPPLLDDLKPLIALYEGKIEVYQSE